jgi:hypothetical protein
LVSALSGRVLVKRTEGIMQRIAVRVVSFFLFTPCAAFSQSVHPLPHLVQGSHVVAQRSDIKIANSLVDERLRTDLPTPLPDAPSALIAAQTDPSQGVEREAHQASRTELKPLVATSGLIGDSAALPPPDRTLIFRSPPPQKAPGAFFRRYFDTSLSRQDYRYQASSKDTLMGRAADAASRIFVTRDEFGNRRLNTSYFVGVLTAVAVHSASRPYWARSNSVPLGDFGSTVGNDAGMNLMHEFGPGLRQAVAGHMPSFVFRVEKRILRETNPRQPLSPRLR